MGKDYCAETIKLRDFFFLRKDIGLISVARGRYWRIGSLDTNGNPVGGGFVVLSYNVLRNFIDVPQLEVVNNARVRLSNFGLKAVFKRYGGEDTWLILEKIV